MGPTSNSEPRAVAATASGSGLGVSATAASASPHQQEEASQSTTSNASATASASEEVTRNLVQMVDDEDALSAQAELAEEHRRLFPHSISVTLETLFDFSVTYWSDAYDALGEKSLREEVHLSEIVDDTANACPGSVQLACGDEEDSELDPSAESVLMSC